MIIVMTGHYKSYELTVVLFLCLVFVSSNASLFNVNELQTAIYNLEITAEPKLSTQTETLDSSILPMVSKHGQQYYCQLPQLKSEDAVIQESYKSVNENLIEIPKLLHEIEKLPCLTLDKGWWQYEFCFKKHIRQFHVDESSMSIKGELFLGYYQSDFDWTQSTEENPQRIDRYHSQEYGGGTKCDLTGLPRRAEVRFVCREDATDHLLTVDEPETCVYQLIVSTPRLCKHPLLARKVVRSPELIQCRPVLPEQAYALYVKDRDQQARAQRAAEEQAKLSGILELNPARRQQWRIKYLAGRRSYRVRVRRARLLLELFYRRALLGTVTSGDQEGGQGRVPVGQRFTNWLTQRRQADNAGAPTFDQEAEDQVKQALKWHKRIRRLSDLIRTLNGIEKNGEDGEQPGQEEQQEVQAEETSGSDDAPAEGVEDEFMELFKKELSKLDKSTVDRAAAQPNALRAALEAGVDEVVQEAREELANGQEKISPDSMKAILDEVTRTLNNFIKEIKTKGDEAAETKPTSTTSGSASETGARDEAAANSGTGHTESEQMSDEQQQKMVAMLEQRLRTYLQQRAKTEEGGSNKVIKLRVFTVKSPEEARQRIRNGAGSGTEPEQYLNVIFLHDDTHLREKEKQDKLEENYKFKWPQ